MICDDIFIRHVVVSDLFVCTVCLNGNQLSILGSAMRNIMKTVYDLEDLILIAPGSLSIPLHMAKRLCEVWKEWNFNWLRKGVEVPNDVIEFLFSLPGEGDSYEDINPPVINEQDFISILRV